MEQIKKILFFADGAKGEKSALRRAVQLAQHNDAELTVFAVVPEVGTNDERLSASIHKLQKALIAERQEKVDKLVSETKPSKNAPKITKQIVPGEKDFIAVIKAVIDDKYDLLIKSLDRAGAFSAVLFGNHDLQLMRQCPCPVWIIKPEKHKTIGTILAAIDLTNEEPESLKLAERIVDIAKGIAEREGSRLHVLTAWDQPLDPNVRKKMEIAAYEDYVSHYKDRIKQRFSKIVAGIDLAMMDDHILRGKPDAAISKFVKDYDVDLLVMGTLSRTGIPGLLIGNTAERVLNQVHCSVLTLKPKGFKPAIK